VSLLRPRDLLALGPRRLARGALDSWSAAAAEQLEEEEFAQAWLAAAGMAGWLGRDAARVLFGLAKRGPGEGSVVEVGSYVGRSTVIIARGLSARAGETVLTIDPHGGAMFSDADSSLDTLPILLHNLDEAGVRDRVEAVRATSEEAAAGWSGPIRLLYVDGLHDYENVLRDIRLWSPHLVADAVVVFDDYQIADVRLAIEQALREGLLTGAPLSVGAAAVVGIGEAELRSYVFPSPAA
jgi:predicted O-methyltransferase YrrM